MMVQGRFGKMFCDKREGVVTISGEYDNGINTTFLDLNKQVSCFEDYNMIKIRGGEFNDAVTRFAIRKKIFKVPTTLYTTLPFNKNRIKEYLLDWLEIGDLEIYLGDTDERWRARYVPLGMCVDNVIKLARELPRGTIHVKDGDARLLEGLKHMTFVCGKRLCAQLRAKGYKAYGLVI